MSSSALALFTAALLLTSLGAAGCVANETSMASRGVVVSGPPPAPIAEERPVPPAPPGTQLAWIAGYWHWTGMHYAWIPGHWEIAPPGLTWAAPEYVTRDGATFYEPGGWRGQPGARANAIR